MLFEEVKCLTCKDRCNNVMRDLLTTSSEKRGNIGYINVNNIGPFQNKICSLWHHIDLSHLTSFPNEFSPICLKPFSSKSGGCCLSDYFPYLSSCWYVYIRVCMC